LLVINKYHFFA